MRKAQPLLVIRITTFHLLYGKRHVKLSVLPVRHDQQILRTVVGGIAVHVMDYFAVLQRSADVCLRCGTSLLRVGFATICDMAVWITLAIELREMSCLMATGEFGEIHILAHP